MPKQENYLKESIKRFYKQYTEERSEQKPTLADIAKLFNIPIDESRLADYEIKKINFNDHLSIELIDKKTGTEYKAEYIYNYDLNILRYVVVSTTSPIKTSEIVYYIGGTEPIIAKISFINGEYKLTFEKERPNDAGDYCLNINSKFTIRYSANKNGQEIPLFSKTFQRHDDGTYVYDFEKTQTNQFLASNENLDSQNNHAFIERDNVMFGVDLFQSALQCDVQGALFESTKISHIKDHFPTSMNLYEPSDLFKDKDTMSAIILMGCTGHNNYFELVVYKTTKGIIGSYRIKTSSNGGHEKIAESKSDFQLPNLDAGMITSREIGYLLENLQARFCNDFIELISGILLEFAKKIDIRKGMIQEELEPLSPRLFFDKSIEEVESMLEKDRDGYFRLAAEQYYNISHQKQNSGQGEVLRRNNTVQSSEQ